MIRDTLARPLRNLRLSVTDRCNLRCQYCMPEEEYVWLPRDDVLTFEEMMPKTRPSGSRKRSAGAALSSSPLGAIGAIAP